MMTKLLEEAIARVRDLPEGEQNAAADALIEYVDSMRDFQLTDEQLEEVRRRRANPNRKFVSLADARERFRKLGA